MHSFEGKTLHTFEKNSIRFSPNVNLSYFRRKNSLNLVSGHGNYFQNTLNDHPKGEIKIK